MKNFLLLLLMGIVGCDFAHEDLEISDGICWRLYGVQDSCLSASFCNKTMRGDLHVEFLEDGLLVSKWDKSIGAHQFGYYNLFDSTFTMFDDAMLPTRLRKMRTAKNVIRSYCLFCLVGRNKIDSERESFDAECKELRKRIEARLSNTHEMK